MRIERRNVVLLVVVLLLVAVRSALEPRGADANREKALLGFFDPALVSRVRIECTASSVELERRGAAWVVLSRSGFPADGRVVEELLLRLRGISSADRVSEDASSLERFGVAEGAARIVLLSSEGELLADLRAGRSAELGRGSFLRLAGSDEVFRAAALDVPDCDPSHWIEGRLLDFSPADVRALRGVLEGARSLHLVKSEDGRWQAVGEERALTAARVEPLLVVASNLFVEDVRELEPEQAGLVPPALVLELELVGGTDLVLHLGRPLADGGRAATRPDWASPWVVELPAPSAGKLEGALALVLSDLQH